MCLQYIKLAAGLYAAMLLASCATRPPEEPSIWGRLDCMRPEEDHALYAQEDQAQLVCTNRAQAAGIAGTAAMPTGYGLGGAIASGINKSIAENQIQSATISSCMAEYGFARMRISEFEARCPKRPPPSAAPATKRRS